MHRPRRLTVLTVVAGLTALIPVAGASPAIAAPGAPTHATATRSIAHSTRTNLLAAMHGEAFARASYLAYAAQAAHENRPQVSRLFKKTAGVELNDHFALEAAFVGLAGDNAANLRDAISGESYETTTMYPQFEAQARKQGDAAAAALFHEIGADEATHRDAYQQALAALSGSVQTPVPPDVAPVTIPAGPAKSSGQTLTNLQAAMHGEAFASAKYLTYAAHARATGHPALARLFSTIANVELKEHFAGEAVLAGLVSTTRTNLAHAATGENWEARSMYPTYARKAAKAGDRQVARQLFSVARDEAGHRDAFRKARKHVKH